MYTTSHGAFAPCCTSDKFYFESPEQYWNSDQLKSMRQQLINSSWPSQCHACKNLATNNLFSDKDLYDRLYQQIGSPLLGQNRPYILDLRPGNKCNLKCRMCAPSASSLIEQEVEDNEELQQFLSLDNIQTKNRSLLHFINNEHLKWLKILGGEPTLEPEVINILHHLVQTNRTDIHVMITTNATNRNKKFFTVLEKFSSVTLKVSIDGAGSAYEYIRTNSSWIKTKTNVEKLLQQHKFNKFIISPVLQPYNLLTFVEFLEWLETLSDYEFIVSYHHSDNDHTHASALTDQHIEVCKNNIFQWAANKDQLFLKKINFYSLVSLLDINHNQLNHIKFIKYNNILDKIRKTDIATIHPLLSSYK